MSFVLLASKYNPVGLYMMDGSTLVDSSAYLQNATFTGTPGNHSGLVNGAAIAKVFSQSSVAKMPSTIFMSPKENKDFSIYATFVLAGTDNSSAIQIVGNNNQMDGITITGTVISFVTKYANSGEARCSYDIGVNRVVNVCAVHTSDKNSLYIDGELVSEVAITASQAADTFVTNDNFLYTGQSSSANTKVAVNGVVLFDKALASSIVNSLYGLSSNVNSEVEVAAQMGGEVYKFNKDLSDYFINDMWSTDNDWFNASLNGVSVRNSRLYPQFNGDTSIASNWVYSVSLSNAGVSSIYGVSFDWNGVGVVISVSLDGTTWTQVQKNVNVSIIPPGFDPTNKELFIMVSFAGGVVNDPSYLDYLNVFGTKTNQPPVYGNRTVTLQGVHPQQNSPRQLLSDFWGARIDAGGRLTLAMDSGADPNYTRTVELWIKATTTTNPGISVSGTYYQDGVAASANFPVGEWTLFHIVTSADFNSDIVIFGPAQVGSITLYRNALTATQIANIAALYTKANQVRVGDTSVIGITQAADAANIYAHDWAIVNSG